MSGYNFNSGDSTFCNNVAEKQKQELIEERRRKRKAKNTGAHTTMPIKDVKMVRKWLAIAKEHDAKRIRGGVSWYLLLLIGFNTRLRISDICSLKVDDIRGRERLQVEAHKTGKVEDIKIQPEVQNIISALLKNADKNDFVLCSRQRGGGGKKRPISRQRAFGIVKAIAKQSGFEQHVGCHTLRKTFGYMFYQASGGDLAATQKILNHSSSAITIQYLGLNREYTDKVQDNMPILA